MGDHLSVTVGLPGDRWVMEGCAEFPPVIDLTVEGKGNLHMGENAGYGHWSFDINNRQPGSTQGDMPPGKRHVFDGSVIWSSVMETVRV